MYFVIAGCGDVGAQIAGTLADKGHNVVIIDRDQTAFERLSPLFDGNAVWGNAIDLDVQRKSGVEKADVFIAVTENDNANLMAAQMAKKCLMLIMWWPGSADLKRRFRRVLASG